MPIELVSKFMRHADSRITETIYASVRREDVGDRILDAIDPRYARAAHRDRDKPIVATLVSIPEPKQTEALHSVGDVSKTLTEWAVASAIAKATLHYRVSTRGLAMADALALGKPSYRPRAHRIGSDEPMANPDCERIVKDPSEQEAPNGLKASPSLSGTPSFPGEFADLLARHSGFEPLAFGFGGGSDAAQRSKMRQDAADFGSRPLGSESRRFAVRPDDSSRNVWVGDAVAESLAAAIAAAANQGRWDVVGRLAGELEARREPAGAGAVPITRSALPSA